jgi:iron-sulfur cluster assembly protein
MMEQEVAVDSGSVSHSGAAPVKLTPKAIEMVKKALEEEGLGNHGLRVAVRGGGCSGLEYALDFSNEARMGDSVYEIEGLTVFIDMASAQYLNGTEIDYVSGLQGQGFKFNNPNATRTCGCGHSFS